MSKSMSTACRLQILMADRSGVGYAGEIPSAADSELRLFARAGEGGSLAPSGASDLRALIEPLYARTARATASVSSSGMYPGNGSR